MRQPIKWSSYTKVWRLLQYVALVVLLEGSITITVAVTIIRIAGTDHLHDMNAILDMLLVAFAILELSLNNLFTFDV